MDDRALENAKHPKWKMFLYYATFICLMLAGFLMVFSLRNKSADAPKTYDGGALGDVLPMIRVQDTIYYWAGISQKHTGAETPGAQVSAPADGTSYLPEGFTECGSFSSTIRSLPKEPLQMQADFPASGTVYGNPDTPEVVYILMTTDWFQNQYIRFVSEALYKGSRIVWNGNHYRTNFTDGTNTWLETLPDQAVSVGTLHYIGQDRIPQDDLETNCLCDNHAYSLEGREVFADSMDSKYLYVYADHYWSGGSYGVYWKLSLW